MNTRRSIQNLESEITQISKQIKAEEKRWDIEGVDRMSENITDYITLSLIGHKEIIKFGTPIPSLEKSY